MTDADHLGPFEPEEEVMTAFEGDLPAGTVGPSALRRQLTTHLPAVAAFFIVLAVWEIMLRVLNVETFLLPKPSEIAAAFVDEFGPVWDAGWTTLQEALGGFAIGVSLGVLSALATARWVQLREGLLPFAIAANSMPIIALAPIANAWFSLTSPLSKMVVVAVVVYFPVMINMVRGLTEIEPAELELMRSFASTKGEVVRRIRVPHSLPYLFSALKVAAALSLIAAIVAEYFGGREDALGRYITRKTQLFQFPDAWAAILVAAIMGMAFYTAILAVERIAMPWHVSFRQDADR